VLSRPWLTAHVKRGLVFGAAAGLLVAVPWMALRWHQDRQMKDLFAAYAAAELETVWPTIAAVEHDMVRLACGPLTPEAGLPVVGPEGHFEVDMIVAEFEPGETPIPIDFVYTGDTPDRNISWRTTIQPVERDAAVTRYYFPVYNAVWPETPDNLSWNDVDVPWTRFDGIALHAKDLPRLRGLQRFKYAAGYTPLLTAVLEPGWEERPLYQQFVR
jgi:hypothetical protein